MTRHTPFLEELLVIGANGYVGRHLVDAAALVTNQVLAGVRTEAPPQYRPETNVTEIRLGDAAAYDRSTLAGRGDLPVVVLPQLGRSSIDWLLDRIDGPRWIVFSSAQLGAVEAGPAHAAAAAREQLAVRRGATVLRPTMIFGRGGDQNITSLIRQIARTRLPLQLGDGSQMLQPVHVDDLIDLVLRIAASGGATGVHEVGGERIPAGELLEMLTELLGVRTPTVSVSPEMLRRAERIAPLLGRRPDQIRRLTEDKVVDDRETRQLFGWTPAPLAHRLEQAISAAGFGLHQHDRADEQALQTGRR